MITSDMMVTNEEKITNIHFLMFLCFVLYHLTPFGNFEALKFGGLIFCAGIFLGLIFDPT